MTRPENDADDRLNPAHRIINPAHRGVAQRRKFIPFTDRYSRCFALLPVLVALLTLCLLAFCAADVAAEDPVPDRQAAAEVTQAEVTQAVHDILSDPEYRHLLREADDSAASSSERRELPQWFRDFLDWLFGNDDERSSSSSPPALALGDTLFYLAIGVLVVVLIVLLVSLFKSRESAHRPDIPGLHDDEDAINPSAPPGDLPCNEYERRALAAAAAGDFRTGLRELVLGSMSWTERAGLIRYRSGLTNRDYVRAVWRQTGRRDSLLEIVASFERVFYGRRVADQEAFATCLTQFRQWFAQEAGDAPQMAG